MPVIINDCMEVEFYVCNSRGHWAVRINQRFITDCGMRNALSFDNLESAMKFAKKRGFIPEKITLEELQANTKIKIN
jgi:hypothetical protein